MYNNPLFITDKNGKATLTLPMADNITTWRMTTLASSQKGQLGSTTAAIRCFQDFFIDIDLPVSLTQNDRVSIPIAIYNYLDKAQTVELELEAGDWFELKDDPNKKIKLNAGDVDVIYYTLQVKEIGYHTLTVKAFGEQMNDAMRRKIRVLPDGKEFRFSIDSRLEGDVDNTVEFPIGSIPKASKLLVKVYPGFLSTVLEGMDKIFRMPGGCFEQTSSSTYPNILVLDYMKETGTITPEIQMKAEGFINSGYQKLLSFECPSGGYEWFGNDPGNRLLTAYGLMEFSDMSKVHNVDPNVIKRIQDWFVNSQESDGSWELDSSFMHTWNIKNPALSTAYILWSLLESGYKGAAADKAINYLRANINSIKDAYTLTIMANAFVLYDKTDDSTQRVFRNLMELAIIEGDKTHWPGDTPTITMSTGKSAEVETSALAILALMKYGRNSSAVNGGINYIIESKDSYGTWHSTQATVLAMKVLLTSLSDATQEVDAVVNIIVNGKEIEQIKITPENSDVMRQVNASSYIKDGKNDVKIKFEGTGSALYQIVGVYYLPWEEKDIADREPMKIMVDYDKTELEKDDVVTCTVKVTNNEKLRANMIILDLGVPPGFSVMTGDLSELVGSKVIQKYELAGRQIIVYLDHIKAKDTLTLTYRLKAKYPIKAQTGSSRAYMYYDPEKESFADPIEIVVK